MYVAGTNELIINDTDGREIPGKEIQIVRSLQLANLIFITKCFRGDFFFFSFFFSTVQQAYLEIECIGAL